VRGPAGCGKSVVALHRTAYLLAHDPGDALIVTFVKTLPAVLHTLYTRLAPLSAARVHVSGMHALAWRIVKDAGVRFDLDLVAAETAFNVAWAQVGRRVLETPDLPRSYWQEEVCSVIKGRGLSDFEDYAALVRTGRRTSLRVSQRQAVWDLYVRYQELLADKRKHDFQDLVALALDVAQRGAARRYRFVVVDEAQDLDLQSIRLLAELVSDERDGLTLVGDGQQAVYAGGYTLKEAGLTVTGRSTVLQVNYRNTKQILDAAAQFVRADDFDDLEELARDGDSPVQVVREGTGVLDVRASDSDSARVALVRQLQVDQELPVRSAAVLCRTRKEAGELVSLLRREGLPVLALEDYDGTPSDAIKVGTAKRAKGLEFSRVYVPRVDSWLTQDGSAEQERVQRERRELYVAMTRARDGLWRCRVEPPAA
jgi:superfamily I DNA/RNA helicase